MISSSLFNRLSTASTMKANLSAGIPLDLHIYETDKLEVGFKKCIHDQDPFYQTISSSRGDALRTAFNSLPSYKL